MLLLLILVLVILACGGVWGNRLYGPVGWSPLALILIVILLLWATGNLAL